MLQAVHRLKHQYCIDNTLLTPHLRVHHSLDVLIPSLPELRLVLFPRTALSSRQPIINMTMQPEEEVVIVIAVQHMLLVVVKLCCVVLHWRCCCISARVEGLADVVKAVRLSLAAVVLPAWVNAHVSQVGLDCITLVL
jgi:hypothetical protein